MADALVTANQAAAELGADARAEMELLALYCPRAEQVELESIFNVLEGALLALEDWHRRALVFREGARNVH